MIFESQLVAILASSPKLRVLHIETGIQGCTSLDHHIEPVFLEELEELDIIQEDKDFAFGNFLRWIAPGPKPLRLNFYGLPDEAGPVEFCARANVTRFFIEEFTSSESFVRMIRHSPWLEILAIKSDQNDEYNDLESILPSIDQQYPNEFAPKTQVDTLLLIDFTGIFFEDIQAVVDAYSVKRLLIRSTSISYEVEDEWKVTDDPQEIKAKLSLSWNILQDLLHTNLRVGGATEFIVTAHATLPSYF
ncbi:hypothetical protein RSOLAG22IIIB_10006 [Rhizoctonia solani]|uniref:F-box domain-containing protein n=1 Tax=Rhizoctonia solani TaxID=456999 RepID=A0A0K6G0I1_9AGAM|nr:hypothetical protein RSOLAG22IIIB_10006 [Rhizoctonia solani]